jgi:fanconi anemia group M protein
VLEIDKVCALKAASSSAPAPAPVQHPPPPRRPGPSATAGGGGRQLTLDRFISPCASVQWDREMPAPAGGSGHPGARAGEGCSRQAGKNGLEDRFMESFSLRREEKAAPAPVAALAGGQRRPQVRAGKGCSRPVVEEVSYDPCAVALDYEAVQTWIYPSEDSLSCCIFFA